MVNTILIDRARQLLIIAGKLFSYSTHNYRLGEIIRKDCEMGSFPYICYSIQLLSDNGEYAIYRANFCEIHGNGEMTRYFIREY